MTAPRLPTDLWLSAQLKILSDRGVYYYIPHKGAEYSGAVLLKLNFKAQEFKLLSRHVDDKGEIGWLVVLKDEWVAESDADTYINRAIDRDPDLWVIEIELQEKENPFEGKIIR
jgi:hypothetical protein